MEKIKKMEQVRKEWLEMLNHLNENEYDRSLGAFTITDKTTGKELPLVATYEGRKWGKEGVDSIRKHLLDLMDKRLDMLDYFKIVA